MWRAEALDGIQGFHVSLDSRDVADRYEGPSANERLINHYTIDEIKFNHDVSKVAFWPTYDKGVYIVDLITKKDDYNTPDKKASQDVVAAKTAVPPPACLASSRPSSGDPLRGYRSPDSPWVSSCSRPGSSSGSKDADQSPLSVGSLGALSSIRGDQSEILKGPSGRV